MNRGYGRLFAVARQALVNAIATAGGSMSHLQYFGFWPGSLDALNSIEEQQGFCNITKAIWIPPGNNTEAAAQFGRARAASMKVLLNFPEGDDRSRLDEWCDTIMPYAADIHAVFLRDEPDCVSGGQADRLAALLAEIDDWIAHLRRHLHSTIGMMMTLGCFNALVPRIGFRLPEGITDIAIEAYHGRAQWAEWRDRLAPYLMPHHRLWLMPLAYGADDDGPAEPYSPRTEDAIIFEATRLYNYAKTDARVIGLLPFAWYEGVQDKPAVRAYFERIGREILMRRIPPVVDHSLQLLALVPHEVMAGRPFTAALIGTGFAPDATVQYAGWAFSDYPSTRLADNVRTLSADGVPAGRYRVRLCNPDGEATRAVVIDVLG